MRSVEEAGDLHGQWKQDWTDRIYRQIARVLVGTGAFHADDLGSLEIPEDHTSIIGSQTSLMQRRGFMRNTEVRRASVRAAANSRKSFIYEITPKGRTELPGMLAGAGATEGKQGEGNAEPRSIGAMDDSAPSTGPSAASIGTTPSDAPSSVGADPGEARLFESGDDQPPATSPYSAEAA